MTSDRMIQVSSLRYGEFNNLLPRPDLIPVPAVASSWEKLIDQSRHASAVARAANDAETAVHEAENADRARMTEAYTKGEGEDIDPRELTAAAEVEAKKARARVEPSRLAELIAARELRDAVVAGREKWQKDARKRATSATEELVGALAVLEEQYAALEASMGVLELLHEDPLPNFLHASWSFGGPELGTAIENLRGAIAVIDRRVRTL